MESIIDRCRIAKAERHMSNQRIADLSGVPLSTVNNFFRAGRSPSIDTTGPICAVLGVSMDDFFGLRREDSSGDDPSSSAEYAAAQLAVSEAERKSSAAQITLQREMIDKQQAGIRLRNHMLIHLAATLLLVVIWALYLDLNCADAGFWR